MDWAKPEYSRSQVDEAGRVLVDQMPNILYDDWRSALAVVNNWRSSHAFPLNTFQMNLRDKIKRVDRRGLVATRIKRLPAIHHKLNRMDLRLSAMQDIGGCRAVVESVPKVRQLRDAFVKSRIKHQLQKEDDYINEPKDDGYRGVHLIYRYYGRTEAYSNLKIEIQLRTNLQHCWATAVETASAFRGEVLKADEGDQEWLRFFALMGTALAARERGPRVPNTPNRRADLVDELRHYVDQLDVVRQLRGYQTAMQVAPTLFSKPRLRGMRFYLLTIDPAENRVLVSGYRSSEEASQAYQGAERKTFSQPGPDVVLVSGPRLRQLKRAFPNYFADTTLFLAEVERVLGP